MMSSYESFQEDMFQEAEGKLIAELSNETGLISDGLEKYLSNPWMEQNLREHEFIDEEDMSKLISLILFEYSS